MMANAGLNPKKIGLRGLTHSTTSQELQAGSFSKLNMLKHSLIQQEDNNLSNALERIRLKNQRHLVTDQRERKRRAQQKPPSLHGVQRLKRYGTGSRTLPSLMVGVVEGKQVDNERRADSSYTFKSNDVRKRDASTAPGRVSTLTSPREQMSGVTRTSIETQVVANDQQTRINLSAQEPSEPCPITIHAHLHRENSLPNKPVVYSKTNKLYTGLASRRFNNKGDQPDPELSPVTYRLGKKISAFEDVDGLITAADRMSTRNVRIDHGASVKKQENKEMDMNRIGNKHSQAMTHPSPDGIRANITPSLLNFVNQKGKTYDLSKVHASYKSTRAVPKATPVRSIFVEMPSIVFQPSSPESDLTDADFRSPRDGKSLQRIFRQNQLYEKEVKDLLEDVREINEITQKLELKARAEEIQGSIKSLQLDAE